MRSTSSQRDRRGREMCQALGSTGWGRRAGALSAGSRGLSRSWAEGPGNGTSRGLGGARAPACAHRRGTPRAGVTENS